jgi:hypothetical protein
MNLQEKMPGQANKNFIKHTYGKLWLLIGLLVFNPLPSPSQKITLDPQKTFQTMHSFGASDCWSIAMVGKYFPQEKKNKIAEWLFSQEVDAQGNPKGIILVSLRFTKIKKT